MSRRRPGREHSDDLELDSVLAKLEADLRERRRLRGSRPATREFAKLLLEAYILFPRPVA